MEVATDTAVRHAMAHADFPKKFRHPLKFNGTDFVETKLSEEEQTVQLQKLLSGSLHVFLERYGAMLEASDLDALSSAPAAETAEAKIWLERLRREPPSATQLQKRARRRRWSWAKREMVLASGFFSEDAMKRREPKLFHEIVGRHLEGTTKLSEPMKGSLSSYLMQRLDQECDAADRSAASTSKPPVDAAANASNADAGASEVPAKRARIEKEGESNGPAEGTDAADAANDSDNASDDIVGAEVSGDGVDITEQRALFLKHMRNRFVNGAESDFNFADIDADSDLDDLAELGQDAEEKYFDADE